eukprot:TRINITY_DN11419_c0_g1_i2.p1 TRINITY_DN11419_c0_g1~~TRINITY_DN11419_c0_g1_i2.p1  ORF type:complete len:464 (+),score=84.16 TRINITY_DN11419_c0_g1_i2:254-1645(+)
MASPPRAGVTRNPAHESDESTDAGSMSLAELRDHLLRLEETIIFALIERAHFAHNPRIYQRNDDSIWATSTTHAGMAENSSFLEYFLKETERVQALLGRFNAEDENAFFPALAPASMLPPRGSTTFLKPNSINMNDKVLTMYLEHILPAICPPGDDGHYGSSANADIIVLQAISKRVHYGKQVAEVKFREQREAYTNLIEKGDADGLMALLTNAVVEAKLLKRVRLKAATYGQDIQVTSDAKPADLATPSSATSFKIDPAIPEKIYRELLIPLTKDIEVVYLLQRLDYKRHVAYLGPTGTFCHLAAQEHFSDTAELTPLTSIAEVFQQVMENKVAFGVVPYFNSQSGLMASVRDLLYDTQARVCADIALPVSHHLMAKCPLSEVGSGSLRGDLERQYNPIADIAVGVQTHYLPLSLAHGGAIDRDGLLPPARFGRVFGNSVRRRPRLASAACGVYCLWRAAGS